MSKDGPVRLINHYSYYCDFLVIKELNYTPFYLFIPYKRNRLQSLIQVAFKKMIIDKLEEEIELCSDSTDHEKMIRMQTSFNVKDEFTLAILKKLN